MTATAVLEERAAMEQPMLEMAFSLAGVGCLLRTNSAEMAALLRRVAPAWSGDVAGVLEVRVREDDDSPAEAPHFRAMHHLVVVRFGAANVFAMDLNRRLIVAEIAAAMAKDDALWQWTVLPIMAGIAGTSLGILAAHSACLAREGDGMLIVGDSGAGKSTLSVALGQRGFDYISDDWTYCSLNRGELMACGMQARTKLLPDAVRHFPELAARATGTSMNGERAFEVVAEETFGVRQQMRCRPRMMVYLQRTEDEPARVRPWEQAEARSYFARNLERIPVQMERARGNCTAMVEELLQLPLWSFAYSGPPDAGAERLEAFFEVQRSEWRVR